MSNDHDEIVQWRDFLDAIGMLTASALADLDAASGSGRWQRTFEVVLLAAAGAEGVRLPETEILSQGSELGVTITPGSEQLMLKLQLQGFAALDQYGGREARLVSDNGAIDYRFRFSNSGSATCILADQAGIREALGKFALFFPEGDGAGAADPHEAP